MDRRAFLRAAITALGAAALPFKDKLLPEEDWSTTDGAGYIDLPSECVNMATVGDYLLVLCKDGLYVVTGEGPFDFKVHKVTTA